MRAAGDPFSNGYIAAERSATEHRGNHRRTARGRAHRRQEAPNLPRHSKEAVQRILQEPEEDRQKHPAHQETAAQLPAPQPEAH